MTALADSECTRRWVKRISPGRLERWLKDRRRELMLREYGGLQTCPWCKQCAQDSNAVWRFDPWPQNIMYDQLSCGVCGGRSLWMWGLGMHFVRPLDHPAQGMSAGTAETPTEAQGVARQPGSQSECAQNPSARNP